MAMAGANSQVPTRSTSIARKVRASRKRCSRAPMTPSATKQSDTTMRGILGVDSGASPSANCQSAYCRKFPSWIHGGACRGKSPATSYCRRPITSASDRQSAGLPWLIAGSCRARRSRISSGVAPNANAPTVRHAPARRCTRSATNATNATPARTKRPVASPPAAMSAQAMTAAPPPPARHATRSPAHRAPPSSMVSHTAAGPATSALACRGAAIANR